MGRKYYHGHTPKYVAEFVGTFFLVFTIGCNIHSGSIGAAVSIGAILMVMVYSLGSVSGAHLNPAVTFAVVLAGRDKIGINDACMYVVAQLAGAIVGALTYLMVFEEAFKLSPSVTYTHHDAASVEILYTAALCYVVLNVATTENREQGNPMPNHFFGLAIGLTLTAAAIAIGPISGCSLNPAVSVGSLFAHYVWHDTMAQRMWALYILSPLGGAALAALFFYAVQGGFSGQFEYDASAPEEPEPMPRFPYQIHVPRSQKNTQNLHRNELYWLDEDAQRHKLTVGLSWKVDEGAGGSVDVDASCIKFTRDGRALQSIYFENRFGREIKARGDNPEESIIKHLGDNLTGHGTGFGIESPSGRHPSPGKLAPPPDDERIEIDTLTRLRKYQPRAEYLFMTVNIFSQATKFEHLTEMKIRIVDDEEDRELCFFEKKDLSKSNANGFVMGVIFWKADQWCFKVIDESFEMPEHKTIRYLEPKLAKIVKQMEGAVV